MAVKKAIVFVVDVDSLCLHIVVPRHLIFLVALRAWALKSVFLANLTNFMEDGNSAHGHKSTRNCCARFRTEHGIVLMPHPSTSPDMNLIEKCWRRIKQALHKRRRQPTTEAEMEAMVLEEWDRIPQKWIHELILKQKH